jgi:mannosyltransferase
MASSDSGSVTSPSTSARYTRAVWIWLGVVLVVATVPRVYELDRVNYWFDESFTLKMAEHGPLELLARVIHDDDNPPLYYYLLKIWIGCLGPLGVPPRGLSVLFGLIAVAGIYFAVLEAFTLGVAEDSRSEIKGRLFAATLAGLLVALSPLHVSWSNQVRMYSLMTALAAVSSAVLLRALHHDGKRSHWIAFTVLTSLQLYTHYFGLFLIAAQFAFALAYAWRTNFRRELALEPRETTVLYSAAGVYLLFLPWQLPFWDHRTRVDVHFPAAPLSWESAGTTLFRAFDLHFGLPVSAMNGFLVVQALVVVAAVLFLSRRTGLLFLVLAGMTPFLAAAVVSLGMRNIFVPRYMMNGQMFLLASVAAAIAVIPARSIRLLLAVLIVAGAGWVTREQCLIRRVDAKLPGMRAAMNYLDERRRPNEPVVVVNPMLFTTLVQYTRQRTGMHVIGELQGYPFYQGTAAMRADEFVTSAQLEQIQGSCVWTVDADEWFGHSWVTPLPAGWKEVGRSRFRDFYAEIVIRRYERTPPK